MVIYRWQALTLLLKKSITKRLIAFIVIVILTIHGFMLNTVTYQLTIPKNTLTLPSLFSLTSKPNQPISLALITDLHGCYYGDNQKDLVDKLKQQQPDAILLGGDIYDDKMPFTHTDTLLSQLPTIAPTFYVDGNHEWRLPTAKRLDTLARIHRYGIVPIMGQHVQIANTQIHLFGLSDPESGQFESQLKQLGEQAKPKDFNILLSHRPERISEYLQYPFDLVLSGHAHGGQWRIPYIMNGLVAPHQGLFPKYAGGLYSFQQTFSGQPKTTHVIVSRGLARESTLVPRFFNRPELVFIKLINPSKKSTVN